MQISFFPTWTAQSHTDFASVSFTNFSAFNKLEHGI
jgi:hypothetical protein